ncbi:MAG: TatD family hydrolase [Bacillota bacterium]
MIDSHCHLTYEELSLQLDAVLARAAAAGVDRMITIGTTLPDARLAVQLSQMRAQIRCVIGIHPHSANEVTTEDLAALRELEREPGVLALGEMGLDYHYDFSPRLRQREVFLAQLNLANQTGRPIVLHCRESIDEALEILKDYSHIPAVFHCFTGSIDEAHRILDRGYLLGFTGVVTFKKSDELRQIVQFVPADRMLLETDSPYLTPEPFRKQKVNEPAMVVHTAAAIAKIRGVDVEEVDRVTSENTRRFFGWA